ncbi:MAG: PLP-dependent aminotransferase family protein [Chloroflexi bacterium]|nr:PLP-dependent aminotransferase family protein [Chloroflexota bacterium]
MSVNWDTLYAERTERMHASDIREILKVTTMPQVISLAGGLPAPEVFPIEEFRAAFDRVLREQGSVALQYSISEGYLPLREQIAERLGRTNGIKTTAGNVLITNGSQQALDLLAKIFLNPGDRVLIEKPSYLGALQAFDAYQAGYAYVPMDEDGMRTDLLDAVLSREHVKFIYAIPNFQNPSGRTMTLERRKQLLEVAGRHGVPIVEDDPYGELRYEGQHLPSLAALDQNESVIYVGTFSKILAPGLRLAWMVIPTELYELVVLCKQHADLHTSTISQMVTYEVSKNNFIDAHVEKIKAIYHERRDVMLDALERSFPASTRWTKAQGGLFILAELPEGIDTREVLVEAVKDNVAFVPGQAFHADGGGRNTMRLNFSNVTTERLTEGVQRLGRTLDRYLSGVTAR